MSVTVEIGSLRERVEIIDPPIGGTHPRIGRIRHANGENVAIDQSTLQRLVQSADEAAGRDKKGSRPHGVFMA